MLSYSLHLSPLPPLLHWSSRLVCRYPPCRLSWGEPVCSPPCARCCIGELKPAAVPPGAAPGTGRAEPPGCCRRGKGAPADAEGHRGSPCPAAPPQPSPVSGTGGGPRGYPQVPSAIGGGEGGAGGGSAPSPSRLQGHFVFPPKDKGQ